MDMMKAARIHTYGNNEVIKIEQAPKPVPAEDEVLVRVYASGINPVDWKVREGYLQSRLPHQLPLILGWDVSGIIEAVGSQVTNYQVGEAIYARPDISRDGSHAEYIVIKANEVARKPTSLDHNHACAVPLAALTAWQGLFDAANLSSGQTVLIHAASGGVGMFAVQLAKWKGAHVIGTASNRNKAFLETLGVDQFIDYQAVPFEEVAMDVDVVFDLVGGETLERSWGVLKEKGILVSIVESPDEAAALAHGVRCGYVFVQPNADQLTQLAELIDHHIITIYVSKVFPLDDVKTALQLSESHHAQGKIVLQMV